jgi:Flp pilus assembly pilin Flp
MLLKLWVWFHDEKGQDLIEYALIVAGLSVLIIVAIATGNIPGAFEGWASGVAGKIGIT